MEFFVKEVFEKGSSEKAHRYFLKFGRGNYLRRFLISLNKCNKIKIKASYELANSFVEFVKENKDIKFSGKILTRDKIPGEVGRKKSGGFIYEVSESSLENFENPYFYLLDANDSEIVLKIKKKIPKPGKSENKIDDKFCSLELDLKYWPKVKETFFWDIPDNVKKVSVEHELQITDVTFPEGVTDPKEIREKSKKKGKIIRKVIIDGKEEIKEKSFEV